MTLVKDDKRKQIGLSLGAGSLLGFFYGLDPVGFVSFFSEAFHHQVVQATIAFTIAAVIHRRGMKKDMAGVTGAIQSLGDALRDELKEMRSEIIKTNTRVEALEKLKE